MASLKKLLLVEQASYAEEAFKNLKELCHQLIKEIEVGHVKVIEELKVREENEASVDD